MIDKIVMYFYYLQPQEKYKVTFELLLCCFLCIFFLNIKSYLCEKLAFLYIFNFTVLEDVVKHIVMRPGYKLYRIIQDLNISVTKNSALVSDKCVMFFRYAVF